MPHKKLLWLNNYQSVTKLTSHCLALKKVDGPTGGPKAGGTTMRRLPPGIMPLIPSSNPEHSI